MKKDFGTIRKTLLLLTMLIILSGCKTTDENLNADNLNAENKVIWDEIVNQEFTADNDWTGVGLYFHEEDSILYCDYLIYGSGLRVAGIITFEVSFNNDGNLVLSSPVDNGEVNDIVLEYENETFILGDLVFEDVDLNFHPDFFVE